MKTNNSYWGPLGRFGRSRRPRGYYQAQPEQVLPLVVHGDDRMNSAFYADVRICTWPSHTPRLERTEHVFGVAEASTSLPLP